MPILLQSVRKARLGLWNPVALREQAFFFKPGTSNSRQRAEVRVNR